MRRLLLIAAIVMALLAPFSIAENATTTSCYDSCKMSCVESGVPTEDCTTLCRDQCHEEVEPAAETTVTVRPTETTPIKPEPVPSTCPERCRFSLDDCTDAGINPAECMDRWSSCFERCFDIPDCRKRCQQAFSGCQRESPLAATDIDCRAFWKNCEASCNVEPEPPRELTCEERCKTEIAPCYRTNNSTECDKKLRVCVADCTPPTPPVSCEARCEKAYEPCVAANVSREDCKKKVLGCIENCKPRPMPPEPVPPQDCEGRCKYAAELCVKNGGEPETCRKEYGGCVSGCASNKPTPEECPGHGCEISCSSRYFACVKSADAMDSTEQRDSVLAKCRDGVAGCLSECVPMRGRDDVSVSVSDGGVAVGAPGVSVSVEHETEDAEGSEPSADEAMPEEPPRPGAFRRFWGWFFD